MRRALRGALLALEIAAFALFLLILATIPTSSVLAEGVVAVPEAAEASLYALPLEVVPIKMAVNTDLFEKNGLELPKTWADVVEAARVITENGNGEEFGYGWSTWTACIRRLTFKESMSSTGKGWWEWSVAKRILERLTAAGVTAPAAA